MKISLMVTELSHIHERLKKINQRGITWKLRKGEQSFLCVTRCPDLIHIPNMNLIGATYIGAFKLSLHTCTS